MELNICRTELRRWEHFPKALQTCSGRVTIYSAFKQVLASDRATFHHDIFRNCHIYHYNRGFLIVWAIILG